MDRVQYLWFTTILLLCPIPAWQFSLSSSPSYIGAVVEYAPITEGQNLSVKNALNYIKFIAKAKEYSADIIVFPEYTLSLASSSNQTKNRTEAASYIPDPEDNVIPCSNGTGMFSQSLEMISCAARVNRMYVVITHEEKVDCRANTLGYCPADGYLIYNTHVTFDRDGKVISRYRKYNLFGEPGINITAKPEPATFETDFGVTFGQFICFDVMFESPAMNLTRDSDVTDIVYSANWVSILPYAYSMEIQSGWAYANDMNFLAAGRSDPGAAGGGSGIFVGRNGYAHVVAADRKSNVLVVSEVPKKIDGKRQISINNKTLKIYTFNKSEISTSDERTGYGYSTTDISPFVSELIDPKKDIYEKSLCYGDFCCDFKIKMNYNESVIKPGNNYFRYRTAAFNGSTPFGNQGFGDMKICSIVACYDDSVSSCGKLFSKGTVASPTTIVTIDIQMPITSQDRILHLPATLASDMKPLNATDFSFNSNKDHYKMRLMKPRKDLLTFAIIGRKFGRSGSSGVSIFSVVTVLTIGVIGRYVI